MSLLGFDSTTTAARDASWSRVHGPPNLNAGSNIGKKSEYVIRTSAWYGLTSSFSGCTWNAVRNIIVFAAPCGASARYRASR